MNNIYVFLIVMTVVISVHLSLLFTAMLTHGHMPSDLMKTAIVPILKNRQGDTSDKKNYRPVAIVTAMSKILVVY